MSTQSIEDYIKAIFQLGDGDPVQTSAIAERLEVRPASVSNMMRRLAKLGLIEYAPYRGALLTTEGEALARRMVRRHRLIERFLTEVLDYPWEEVHDEAERLEHAVSARFVEAIDNLLERPLTDPHGAPIPKRDGSMEEPRYTSLDEIAAATKVTVRRVRDSDADLLRYFGDHGIRPGAELEVIERSHHDGPVSVRIGKRTVHLGTAAARGVYVEPNEVH
jgi:DtxR family Mn-dependent transcriptional regulator